MLNTKDTVNKIMTPDPLTINEDTTMDKVATIFEKKNIHHIPVMNEGGQCTGIISMTDFMMLHDKFSIFNLPGTETINNAFLKSLLAKEVMTKDPISILTSDTTEKAIKLFLKNAFHALLVNEGDKMVGIITPQDILKELVNNK